MSCALSHVPRKQLTCSALVRGVAISRCQHDNGARPHLEPHQATRRLLLGTVGLLGADYVCRSSFPPASSAADKGQSLCERLDAQGPLYNPGGANALLGEKLLLLHPKWLFGEWSVESIFTAFNMPLGPRFVDPVAVKAAQAAAEDGGVGNMLQYKLRFYSTLPDTLSNNLRVGLGLLPEDAIIADRAFNTQQLTNATLGYDAVTEVQYDSRNPGRETVQFSQLGPDLRPLPPFRVELYINAARGSGELQVADKESAAASNGGEAVQFCTSELYRQVALGVREASVKDYEAITSYTLQQDGSITGRQRIAVYLQPQDNLYFEAFNRAVSVYDYSLRLKRAAPDADAPQSAAACVPTPKGFIQCI